MIAVRILALSCRTVHARVRLIPSETGGVKAIADRIIVRRRHSRQPLRTDPYRVDPCPIGVPDVGKEIERVQKQRCAGRGIGGQRLARPVDRRCRREYVPIPPGISARRTLCQITENSGASLLGENGYKIVLLFQKPLIVNKYEKERLVLFDRSTQTSTELVPVLVTLRSARQFWKIGHSRELGIVIRVKQRAVVLVAPGARSHLYLGGASSKRRIDVVGRNRYFNVLCSRRDLKREIQADLLPLAQYYVVIRGCLKSGKRSR